MLKKGILSLGGCISLSLLWFSLYSYMQAGPIAQENLRGLALSITAAIEKLAVRDSSLADLAGFHPVDVSYFALVDRRGVYCFHSNPDLIGKHADGGGFAEATPSESRVTLGTGESAFQYTTPIYLPHDTLLLRLTLHTFRADAVVRRAKVNTTILIAMLVAGWVLVVTILRYARREELHQLEMARKESLARVGEMGALLAHEIRNPLSGIKGFAQVIAKRPAEERNAAFARNIVTETLRLENLVTELLAYASISPPEHTMFDLGDLIRHSASLLAAEAAELRVEIVLDHANTLQLCGDRDRLGQVLLNLGKNALHAMPEGGVLSLAAAAAGNKMVISVKDSGHGVADEDLAKVFEPFFTTKARGTGLGLALCKKIVEEHHGEIALSSTIQQGTTVTVTLPCC